MKNFFKLGFVALALSLSFVACNSETTAEGADTTTVAVDTNAVDTNAVDTNAVPAADTTAAPVAQ